MAYRFGAWSVSGEPPIGEAADKMVQLAGCKELRFTFRRITFQVLKLPIKSQLRCKTLPNPLIGQVLPRPLRWSILEMLVIPGGSGPGAANVERWLSGRKRRFAKPVWG